MGPSPRLVSLVLGAKMAGPVNCRVERALGRALSSMRRAHAPPQNLAGPFLHREVVRSIPVKRLAVQHERPKQKFRLGNPRALGVPQEEDWPQRSIARSAKRR